MTGYVGRFAPSPTGLLHAGSLVAALASWLDARAHAGQWLVRIEDVDTPRCIPGAAEAMLKQLADCGLHPDAPPLWQSTRGAAYREALDRLVAGDLAYPCACSRREIELAQGAQRSRAPRHGELVYPGTCRDGLHGRAARAWRFRLPGAPLGADEPGTTSGAHVVWLDRRLGEQRQDVGTEVGDFVLLRADALWPYQLAVVVDDAAQGVTDVVRGEDLADNTPRQLLLQRALGFDAPRYLHTPLVMGVNGEKLSKQNGAEPLDTAGNPLAALSAAARVLGLPDASSASVPEALAQWVYAWRDLYNRTSL